MADNRATVTIGGKDYELEASLGAQLAYSNEFRGKLSKPYTGSFLDDMLQLYRDVEGDNKEQYYGFPPQMFGIVWAMAKAAGSFKGSYKAFEKEISESSGNIYEIAAVYQTVVHGLGDAVCFREPEGLRDTDSPDDAEAVEG